MRLHRAVFVLVPFLLSACDAGGGESSPGFTVRDSAGIQIVENTAPLWEEGEGWTLGATPVVDIGVVEGAPEYQLSQVTGALRLSGGQIAVVNGGSQEIRYYDASGAYLRSVGGKGGGPGEFQAIGWIHRLPGDSLLAYDFFQQRLSVFSPEGDFVRSATVERAPGGGLPFASGALRDGSIVVRVTISGGEFTEGLQRREELFLHYSAAGALLDTISLQPGSERVVHTESDGGELTAVSVMTPLFGRSQVQAMNGDRVVLGGNDAYELAVYTPEGALERLVRRRQEPRPVTDAALEAARQARLANVSDPERRQSMERSLREMPRPATMPFYSTALLDDEANLWVLDYQPTPAAGAPAVWTVFDPEGRMLGTVSMPERFRPMQIGRDFVLGVGRDELDVEHVRMYALKKAG